MLIVEEGKIIEEYDEFIDIEELLDSKIIKLTGIDDELLSDESS